MQAKFIKIMTILYMSSVWFFHQLKLERSPVKPIPVAMIINLLLNLTLYIEISDV